MVGWKLRVDEPGRFELEADGRLMTGRLVFPVSDDVVQWSTLLRWHRVVGRRVWAIAGHAHRALAPRCLVGDRETMLRGSARSS